MLQAPDLRAADIAACLRRAYGLHIVDVEFLPLGVDTDAAVYRVADRSGADHFLKLRRGAWDETALALPRLLSDQGIAQIIAPLATVDGKLWTPLGDFRLALYPYIEGRDGYTSPLTDAQWRTLGAALGRIHTAELPPALLAQIRRETYAPSWHDKARTLIAHLDDYPRTDAIAAELASFLQEQAAVVLDLADRAGRLARQLQAQPPVPVVCHADLHAGNVLIDGDGALYIVDWDNPIRAAKERDLMFAGGCQFGGHRTPAEEEALFYAGYGPVEVDPVALTYYRYIRILEDLVLYAEDIFLHRVGEDDRAQALHYFQYNFRPGATIDAAYAGDRTRQ